MVWFPMQAESVLFERVKPPTNTIFFYTRHLLECPMQLFYFLFSPMQFLSFIGIQNNRPLRIILVIKKYV